MDFVARGSQNSQASPRHLNINTGVVQENLAFTCHFEPKSLEDNKVLHAHFTDKLFVFFAINY